MAEQIVISLVDDLDGSEAEETVDFALDGVTYQIDLSEENAGELREALAVYVEHGRRSGGRRRAVGRSSSTGGRTASADRELNQEIRVWARNNGFEISERGRIPTEVIDAFNAKK
jgi:hypothetical protein